MLQVVRRGEGYSEGDWDREPVCPEGDYWQYQHQQNLLII